MHRRYKIPKTTFLSGDVRYTRWEIFANITLYLENGTVRLWHFGAYKVCLDWLYCVYISASRNCVIFEGCSRRRWPFSRCFIVILFILFKAFHSIGRRKREIHVETVTGCFAVSTRARVRRTCRSTEVVYCVSYHALCAFARKTVWALTAVNDYMLRVINHCLGTKTTLWLFSLLSIPIRQSTSTINSAKKVKGDVKSYSAPEKVANTNALKSK